MITNYLHDYIVTIVFNGGESIKYNKVLANSIANAEKVARYRYYYDLNAGERPKKIIRYIVEMPNKGEVE